MTTELEYTRPQRMYLCEFSLETCIYDPELPTKIKEKLSTIALSQDLNKTYFLEVCFDAGTYQVKEFYDFPVERKPWQVEKLEHLRPQERAHTMINDVLSQQLHNVCSELSKAGLQYNFAAIAGEEFNDLNRVNFCLFEDPAIRPPTESTGKKGQRKETRPVVYSVIPHRPWLSKRATQLFVDMAIAEARKEQKKEFELSQHTPNMVRADKVFTAIASAILVKTPREFSSPESLGYELTVQSTMKNDWPLEIVGEQGILPKENGLSITDEIDCPEFLIYIQRNKHWTVKKIKGLNEAKRIILYSGYNQKSTKEIVVLHNLEPVFFTLFTEEDGEIKPVAKEDAYTVKKLLLSWKK